MSGIQEDDLLALIETAINTIDDDPEGCLPLAEEIQKQFSSPQAKAWAQCVRGMALADREQGQAKELLEAALRYAEEAFDSLLFGTASCYLGFVYLRQGNIKAVGLHCHDALALLQQLSYPSLLASCYRNLAAYYHSLSLFDDAMKYLEAAFDLYQQHRPELTYRIGGNMGILYAELKLYSKAEDAFRKAAESAAKRDDLTTEMLNLSNLQHLLNIQTKAEAAIEVGLQVLARMRSVTTSYLYSQIYENLGMSYTLAERFDEGLEYYQRCMDNLKDFPNPANECALMFAIAMNYFKQGWQPLALSHFQQSLQMAEDLEDKVGQYRAHEQIASILEELADHQNALMHYKRFNELEKAVHSEKANNRIVNLTIAHEVETSQREKQMIQQKNEELERLNQELERHAVTDELTKCFNRQYLRNQLQSHFNLAKRSKLELSLIICNIDRFSDINRRYSHDTGDRVLNQLALLIQSQRRNYDIVSRYGYDEFVLLLPNTPANHAVLLAERIRDEIAAFDWQQLEPGLKLSVSFGVSSGSQHEHYQQLLEQAETRRHDAKYSSSNAIGV